MTKSKQKKMNRIALAAIAVMFIGSIVAAVVMMVTKQDDQPKEAQTSAELAPETPAQQPETCTFTITTSNQPKEGGANAFVIYNGSGIPADIREMPATYSLTTKNLSGSHFALKINAFDDIGFYGCDHALAKHGGLEALTVQRDNKILIGFLQLSPQACNGGGQGELIFSKALLGLDSEDTDGDGQNNDVDTDDDNDGVPDVSDLCPWHVTHTTQEPNGCPTSRTGSISSKTTTFSREHLRAVEQLMLKRLPQLPVGMSMVGTIKPDTVALDHYHSSTGYCDADSLEDFRMWLHTSGSCKIDQENSYENF